MSFKVERYKYWYEKGYYTDEMLVECVRNYVLTRKDYKQITGKDYIE